jgi:hypothetical protein
MYVRCVDKGRERERAMTNRDVLETREAMKKVAKKYGASEAKAKLFLKKMGYLDKAGKVARAYSSPKGKASAA